MLDIPATSDGGRRPPPSSSPPGTMAGRRPAWCSVLAACTGSDTSPLSPFVRRAGGARWSSAGCSARHQPEAARARACATVAQRGFDTDGMRGAAALISECTARGAVPSSRS
jgi:hypothetical protein